jgi:hypothetical protein
MIKSQDAFPCLRAMIHSRKLEGFADLAKSQLFLSSHALLLQNCAKRLISIDIPIDVMRE